MALAVTCGPPIVYISTMSHTDVYADKRGAAAGTVIDDKIAAVVRQYWGFDSLRPLQADAIGAALAGRDSLVVMPTGGGKSLCYQTPPVVDGSLDIVVSPLISLMKDQVDGLRACGYPAACLHSGLTASERQEAERGLADGKYRLLFMAPERLVNSWFLKFVSNIRVKRFAIDEAHCISHWGHDFRPEYRQLSVLRERFPAASLHAFTATATPRVQKDIAVQLGLRDPAILVGCFDRPNLIYRILPALDRNTQIVEVIGRHRREATIVYCISRKDTEATAAMLRRAGVKAAHYHAGMESDERHRVQEMFSDERLDVVVATVAFGMGIDRSNVRCVLHAAMPKSVEHYQQETGRAGRDGLEAECVLLYTFSDVMRWESLVTRSAEESGVDDPQAVIATQMNLVKQLQRVCTANDCRHKMLSEYFGQRYEQPNCGACDVCLGEVEGLEDATVTAQKILSCVARTGERFGVKHIVDVLQGADTDNIRKFGHFNLSTYGLLKEMSKKELQAMAFQLVDQGLMNRSEGEYPTLQLNDESWAVMRGQREVRLQRAKQAAPAKTKAAELSWEGVDRGLFDHLRDWRRQVAAERKTAPFIIFDDKTLMQLARVRPVTLDYLSGVHGIGEKRLADFGEGLIQTIGDYCQQNNLPPNQGDAPAAPRRDRSEQAAVADVLDELGGLKQSKALSAKDAAYMMFAQGRPVAEVAHAIGRAPSTTQQYLTDFISQRRPKSIDAWVPPAVYERIVGAAAASESGQLRPVFDKLNGEVPFEQIRLVLAHLAALAGA